MPNTTNSTGSTQRLLRLSTAITTKCSVQSAAYGKCVVANFEKLNKDTCSKEFIEFNNCIKSVISFGKKMRFSLLSATLVILMCYASRLVVEAIEPESLTADPGSAVTGQFETYTIRGKINIRADELDLENTRILVDDGAHVGFLRADGTFSIQNLPTGSYILEVSSPRNYYEPVRVDINSKGKIRTRRLNLIQPSDITILHYPLAFESRGYPNYFAKREQFRILDILMSPMVLMMVLPLVLIVILPKLINQDPELQRELQQTSSSFLQPNQNMPGLSEIMYNYLEGGNKPGGKKTKSSAKSSSSAESSRKNK